MAKKSKKEEAAVKDSSHVGKKIAKYKAIIKKYKDKYNSRRTISP